MFKLRYIKFTAVQVDDQERALHFYTKKLGFRVAQDAPYQDGWRWIELELPEADTRLIFTKRDEAKRESTPSLVLVTDDVQNAYEKLAKEGVEFTSEPAKAPWNPSEAYAVFRDSEGNGIVLNS